MLLTITTTHRPATDLGFLLHKHPDRLHSTEFSLGRAHVFYPEASEQRCTAVLLLEIDPIGFVKGRKAPRAGSSLEHYVNDRPYTANSLMSVAMKRVFGTAMGARSKERQALAETSIPLEAHLPALPCRGGESLLRRLFEPLGYTVECERHPLDPRFPSWGESRHHTVTLRHRCRLAELLGHLYVLVPVLDDEKHYWVDDAEVENLLAKGKEWLSDHPERELIVERYLAHQRGLSRSALGRLTEEEGLDPAAAVAQGEHEEAEAERTISLAEHRIEAVKAALLEVGPKRVIDLGCGEGRLISSLRSERSIAEIVGMDVSSRSLTIAERRLKLDRLPAAQAHRIRLLQGSLIHCDQRLTGFDAAAVVEVIEHLDPPRLAAFERVLFDVSRPTRAVITTPNREYNVKWESLPAGRLRHRDHRFEWTREEFQGWASRTAEAHGYAVEFRPVGPIDPKVGPPTQMGVFDRCA